MMGDNVENLILEHLRMLRQGQSHIEHELRELQARIGGVEAAILSLRRDVLYFHEDTARQQASLDHLKERVQRIEKRLDLHEPA